MTEDQELDIQKLVDDAMGEAQATIDQATQDVEAGTAAETPEVGAAVDPNADRIQMLSDVELQVTIELGRTEMMVEDVLRLGAGGVVELDKLAGDPVDVYVNERLIARGEVLVLNDNFCIRISEIVGDLGDQAQAALQEQVGAS